MAASAGMVLLGVGISKGLAHRPVPPLVAAVIWSTVPSTGFMTIWLQLHKPWAVPAVMAGVALLWLATRTGRGHVRR